MPDRISLTQKNLDELMDAFGHYFPENTVYSASADKPFSSYSGEYNWNNRQAFINYIKDLTGVIIKNDKDKININEAQKKLVELVSAPTSETKISEANTLTPGQLEGFEAQAEERSESWRKARESAEKQVEDSIRKISGRKVIVTPTRLEGVSLTTKDKAKIFELAQALNADPATAKRIIQQKIKESVNKSSEDVRQNITDQVIEQTVNDLTQKLSPYANFKNAKDIPNSVYVYNSASPFIAITNADDPKLKEIVPDDQTRVALTESAKATAIALDAKTTIDSALVGSLFDESENITYLFYPKNIDQQFQIAEKQDQEAKDNGIEIDLESTYDQGKKIRDSWKKLSGGNATPAEVYAENIRNASFPTLAGELSKTVVVASPLTKSLSTKIIKVNFPGTMLLSTKLLPTSALAISNPQIMQMISGVGISQLVSTATPLMGSFTNYLILSSPHLNMSVVVGKGFTAAGQQMVGAGLAFGSKSTLAISATSKGIAIAATGTFAKVVGFITGPIGTIITTAVSWLISKIPWDKVKKFFKEYGGPIAIAFFGSGIIFRSVPLIVVGTPFFAGGLIGTRGPAKFFRGILNFYKIVAASLVIRIATPILVAILSLPIFVALIIFIINSGAYVTPPASHTGTIEIVCNTEDAGGGVTSAESPVANAAICIVSYLDKFGVNPLKSGLLNSPGWSMLKETLPASAFDALERSTLSNNWLQCVGFSSATAGFAFGTAFNQINACSYIGNPPTGYTYYSGTGGIQSGDFFLMDGTDGCSSDSPGHIGVVVSVDGALISCADANMIGKGEARASNGCFALSQIDGYFRK